MRISVYVKAKVAVRDFSREVEARCIDAPKANDHDMDPEAKLEPVGILEVVTGLSMIIFGNSQETSVHARRTRFVNRMTAFADKIGLEIHLVYYPPYHSK